MPRIVGRIDTPNSSKYLQQLCKHFGHKISVEHDTHSGHARFSMGSARLTADDQTLTVEFPSIGSEDIPTAHDVIDRHLEKFAFRENITGLNWSPPTSG
ncbi:MAG: DUF2218 domain-containing protein [Litoreibacter sp.]|uniref:DUF2218 domain-containing protein n=1 Tax=Litoreibacter sp. TaxID=1969459 RepID=UPI00329A10E6